MCYTQTTYEVCDDYGDDIKISTADKICPSKTRCSERDRRPRRQEEKVSKKICDRCQPYTNREYRSSRSSETGRSRSRTETDRVHTIRTDDSRTDRGERRRRDSTSSYDSDATIRGGHRKDDRTTSRRKFDSMIDKSWDAKDSKDPKERSHGRRHGGDRHDTVSSMTDSFSSMNTSDSPFRHPKEKSFRPLESDRDSTYRGSDSTYRGSDSTYRGCESSYGGSGSIFCDCPHCIYIYIECDKPHRPSTAPPSRFDSLPRYRTTDSASDFYASTESVRGFTNIQSSSISSRSNLIPLRNVLRQYGLSHSEVTEMYKKCKGTTLPLPRSFDEEYPHSKLFQAETGEFFVNLHRGGR